MAFQLFRVFLIVLPASAGASSTFLHRSPQKLTSEQNSAVLAAIEDALGEKHRQATEVRLAPLEKLLAPTLNALPKNEYGRFGHKAARYALHRLFVQRHAWFVKGIGANDNSGNATPASMLQGGVSELVQNLFEKRLGSHGLDAHEVAVMAATLENLVHAESMERLRLAYEMMGLLMGGASLTADVVDVLLDIYMAAYVTDVNLVELVEKNTHLDDFFNHTEFAYPGWSDMRSFVRQVREESASGRQAFSSVDISHIVTRIGDKYGHWQHHECDTLKRDLFAIDDDGTGRVSLSKFYGSALNHGQWQFAETVDYLRSLGALDESNPSTPRVIVTNYILSPSNCVASSSYYSVCCLDECENLMDHLEQEIQAPAAKPARIVDLVQAMPSSSAFGNRSIPTHLLGRLDGIAANNAGLVPLHGRLFAQWMHHVYPRECPYPHLSGTTKFATPENFAKEIGSSSLATPEEMQQHIDRHSGNERYSEVMWSDEDELYVEAAAPARGMLSWLFAFARVVVFCIAASSTTFFVMRVSQKAEADAYALSKYV
jgi:hypothetical protein